MLRRIDTLTGDITALDTKIAEYCQAFTDTVQRLDEIPGVGVRSATRQEAGPGCGR